MSLGLGAIGQLPIGAVEDEFRHTDVPGRRVVMSRDGASQIVMSRDGCKRLIVSRDGASEMVLIGDDTLWRP